MLKGRKIPKNRTNMDRQSIEMMKKNLEKHP